MSGEQASNSAADTEVVGPASREVNSAKSGKRRRKLGPARAQAKAQTRQALIDAAERLFIQEGFDQPGLDVICSVAGRTRGAYNVHFGSREHLVEAVALRALESFEAELLGNGLSLPSGAAPPRSVPAPSQPFPEPDGEARRLPVALILHAAARIPNVREAVLASFERIRRYLGEMAAQGRLNEPGSFDQNGSFEEHVGFDKHAGSNEHGRATLRLDAAPTTVAPMLLAIALGIELLEAAGPRRLDLDRQELNELLFTLLKQR
ncbi:MAG: TetR/AcrR family transcriptional regulator [Polyangiaceae bacterium]|nr:TetR/AcrR family transcriptional regulator [Myxococcales bacterium]MCB9589205.1 TetR/AcrR family transcriptional regulator [Polyangiaceae bacterium]